MAKKKKPNDGILNIGESIPIEAAVARVIKLIGSGGALIRAGYPYILKAADISFIVQEIYKPLGGVEEISHFVTREVDKEGRKSNQRGVEISLISTIPSGQSKE